jgi:hypothetical protein
VIFFLENQKMGSSLVSELESVGGAIIESGLESGNRLTERVESRDTFLERTESGGEVSKFSRKNKRKDKGYLSSDMTFYLLLY